MSSCCIKGRGVECGAAPFPGAWGTDWQASAPVPNLLQGTRFFTGWLAIDLVVGVKAINLCKDGAGCALTTRPSCISTEITPFTHTNNIVTSILYRRLTSHLYCITDRPSSALLHTHYLSWLCVQSVRPLSLSIRRLDTTNCSLYSKHVSYSMKYHIYILERELFTLIWRRNFTLVWRRFSPFMEGEISTLWLLGTDQHSTCLGR